jgi:D-Tyr-tRNAtyr deacylase
MSKTVIQRVLSAQVLVGGEVVGSIGPGLLCLVGWDRSTTPQVFKAALLYE